LAWSGRTLPPVVLDVTVQDKFSETRESQLFSQISLVLLVTGAKISIVPVVVGDVESKDLVQQLVLLG
jgi:hypothetical protein